MFGSKSSSLAVVTLVMIASIATHASAVEFRVLPEGQLPNDVRLGPLKTLDDYFPFHPCKTRAEWEKRAAQVRRQMLVALGLWPMPKKTPLHAVVHGEIKRRGFVVRKVYFESFPGHYVTGNLYLPDPKPTGKLPAVLCPHGHWRNGRFYDAGPAQLKRQLESGAEKLDPCGRYPIQCRCVQLARMGCVVFNYDMVGYADSKQLQHRPGLRPHMCGKESWGYFSLQAELRLQNMMGLQTYNSIRALDWLASLPEVDPTRIGVTGASGGGTQTFILCAIDPRPAVAFPAVMVSTAMQGGCTCENACYLRIGTGNVEFAALFAPKPLGMTAADDWTREMPEKGFPQLKEHYTMLGAPDNVMLAAFLQFGHNYNYPSRMAMYGWMNRHLRLGMREPFDEQPFEPLTPEELTVWDEDHPAPPGGDEYERSLLRYITRDSVEQLSALIPNDPKSLKKYREIIGGAWQVMIGRTLPRPGELSVEWKVSGRVDNLKWQGGLINNKTKGETTPCVWVATVGTPKAIAIVVHPHGKQAALTKNGRLRPLIHKLTSQAIAVVAIDMYGQGEFTRDGQPIRKARLDPKRQQYAGYTYGYNHPVFSKRVHDILSAAVFSKKYCPGVPVFLIGLEGAGRWAAAAQAVAGHVIAGSVIDTAGFRFETLESFDDPDFLPGAVKYFDLPGAISLCAPQPLLLLGEKEPLPNVVTACYRAAGAMSAIALCQARTETEVEEAVAQWLAEHVPINQ